jgi:protein TonB
VRRRLLGLALSVALHAALVVAVLSFVRIATPPVLFVDLAYGLDLAEQAVADLRRAVAEARSRVSPRAQASRGKPDDGSPGRAATPAPALPPPSTVAPPVATRPAEAPAPPEPLRSAAEPPLPPATNVAPAPPPDVVEPTPSALASGRSSGTDGAARGASGPGASGGAVSLSDAGGGGGQRSGLALALPGGGGGDPSAADYAGYYDTLRRRLHESLAYPALARRRGLSGTVLVDVEVDASGKLGRVTLVRSSSHAMLDDAALEAVRGVSRVPFPPGVPPRRLLVRLPVVFEMR